MLTVQVDTHTHTLASGHAFSTIGENISQASGKGLSGIGMTDHFSPIFSPMTLYNGMRIPDISQMMNMQALPKIVNGVRVFAGVEIDIVSLKGDLAFCNVPSVRTPYISLGEALLKTRDYSIASYHGGFQGGSRKENTLMYCRVLENPYIQIIGHIGRSGLPFFLDDVLKKAREFGKMIEINEHSFDFDASRPVCREIAKRCAQLGVFITVSSDAHCSYHVGDFERSIAMLEDISFPQELIANESLAKFSEIYESAKQSNL